MRLRRLRALKGWSKIILALGLLPIEWRRLFHGGVLIRKSDSRREFLLQVLSVDLLQCLQPALDVFTDNVGRCRSLTGGTPLDLKLKE
jgi:hypothetical protein